MAQAGPTIISGGQAGVSRGALDAALETDTPCGGWCPQGRRAEDGAVPAQYPLEETDSPEYTDSVRQNVTGSDATLLLAFGGNAGSAELAERLCHAHSKPLPKIDGRSTDVGTAEQKLFDFLRKYSVHRLHVTGPSRSECPQGYDYAHRLLLRLLRR